MKDKMLILVINPGSTSTKVALFETEQCIKQKTLKHLPEELNKFERVIGQYEIRMNAVLDWMKKEGIDLNSLNAVVGRGGILRPIPGGTYIVTDAMIEDLKSGEREEHASNLGAIIARGIAEKCGIPAYIVDPVSIDEFDDIARISGHPELPRNSLVHGLNIKAISRKAAKELGRNIEDINLVVAHLGGGISICPVRGGRIIDANVATNGGPFSPERTGGLPSVDIVRMAYSGKYTLRQLKRKVSGEGGLVGYLGINDVREVEELIEKGNKKAELVFNAMCYQISREIVGMATVLCGKIDAVVLTGGMAYSKRLVDLVAERVGFIAPVVVMPGEDEMLSLSQGAVRVLSGREKAKIYEEEVLSR